MTHEAKEEDRSKLAPLIVHVVYRFDVGGLENGIVNLINRMPADRWRHAIVALTEVSESFCTRIARKDVTYIALRKKPGHLLREYSHLYRLFRSLQPAIVHTRNLAALEATVPAWAAGVPVRIHGEHGWDVHDPAGARRRFRLVRRAYRPFVHRYIALSQDIETYLETKVGVGGGRVRQIYNGVDTARFRPAQGSREPIEGCPFTEPQHWLVGTVGRMEAVKDPVNLAKAFIRAVQINSAARRRLRLVMVGDGALRGAVESVLEQGGVRELAWIAGERSDVPEIMHGLDCFALPSLSEGVSNTILEAMASGLPVVATRVGGNAELIEPGMTGQLVPGASSEALADAIVGYFADRSMARRHGKAARRVVEMRFSLDRMVADYVSTYERALIDAGIIIASRASSPSGGERFTAGRGPRSA